MKGIFNKLWYVKEALKYYAYNHFVSFLPSYQIRHAYLRKILKYTLAQGVSIHLGCFFTGKNLKIGKNSVINRKCYLDCRESINIGENVSISPECYLITVGHLADSASFKAVGNGIVIGDHVWVGARAMVLPGKTLSKGSILAAGAVLTKNFPEFSILGGNPASIIGSRSKELNYQLAWFPYFDTDIMN